jgi:hypothetical protein
MAGTTLVRVAEPDYRACAKAAASLLLAALPLLLTGPPALFPAAT